MTPEEKAKDLVEKFASSEGFMENALDGDGMNTLQAKECALIAVDEILKNDSVGMSSDFNHVICDTDYWQQVKDQISKIIKR